MKAPLKAENGRFSAKRNSEAALQLLRGEDLDLLSRSAANIIVTL